MRSKQRPLFPHASPRSATGIAGYLATLIDQKARSPVLAGGCAGRNMGLAVPLGLIAPWGTDALIWVEDDAGPVAVRDRSMIAIACELEQTSGARTYLISYPKARDSEPQRISAMTVALAGMGWRMLASKLRRTAAGNVNTTVFVDMARPGWEQRLWLAELAGNPVASKAVSASLPTMIFRTRDRPEACMNDGGTGSDAK